MPQEGSSLKGIDSAEHRAIENLIKQINETDQIRQEVPRRIWFLFAIFMVFSFSLLFFALTHDRRDRRVRPKQK